jgi:hypothetical protein
VVDVLIDLGLPPIVDIPLLLKTAHDALVMVALVLKHLQEVLDSSASPWGPSLFFVSPLLTIVKTYVNIYMYIYISYIYLYFYLSGVEKLCH